MTNQLQTNGGANFNKDGNQIISEQQDGAGKKQVIKYGLIKLAGDKEERRVSFRTLLNIKIAQDEDVEAIEVRELNMLVKTKQVVTLRSETEEVRVNMGFTQLPTEILLLSEGFERLTEPRVVVERNHDTYYVAEAHYKGSGEAREYFLDYEHIQKLVKIEKDQEFPEYPHLVTQVWKYGVPQM